MLTTGELEIICMAINWKYGHDCPVYIQFYKNDTLMQEDCDVNFSVNADGTLYLNNKPLKFGNCGCGKKMSNEPLA